MKLKKTLFLALIIFAILLVPKTVNAEVDDEFSNGEITYTVLNEDEKTVEVSYWKPELTNVIIPETVTNLGKTYTVTTIITSIENKENYGTRLVTTISIPKTVTTIGKDAFFLCKKLEEIIVHDDNPNFLSENGILFNKDKTELIRFPQVKNLTTYNVPDTIKVIKDDCFWDCALLESVTIPNSVTKIGQGAFAYCLSLTNVTIPNTIQSIENQTFQDCASLETITLPDSITSIGENSFRSCRKLVNIKLPNSLTKIGYEAFLYCEALTNIVLPNTVTIIEEYTFQQCISLTSITIPRSVTQINNGAFWGCNSLTIYGDLNSTAHSYAKQNGIPFVELSYNLTFDANGGTYSDNTTQKTVNFKISEGFPILEAPIRDDYIFGGFVDKNGESFDSYLSNSKLNNGMEFKTEWIKLVDNKVIDFTKPTDPSEYEWILLDILMVNNLIEITPDYIKDASGKTLVTKTTDNKYVSADNLTVSDNISYTFTESDLNTIGSYNNLMMVGKITEIPRKIELIFANSTNNSQQSGVQQPAPEPQPTQPSQTPVGEVQNQTTQTNNPRTGDTITLWISILVISLSGLVLIKKKK